MSANPDVLACFLPSAGGGGAERSVRDLASRLAARPDLAVDLVLARGGGPLLDGLDPAVGVVDLGAARLLGALPALTRYLRRRRPRTLLATPIDANLIALAARAASQVPTRLVLREANSPRQNAAGGGTLRARLGLLAARRLYRRADAVVAVSEGVAEELRRDFDLRPGQLVTAPNPVVTPELEERARAPVEDTDVAAWLAGDLPVVLGVGRLDRQKGFDVLLDAFARARQQTPCRLVILGEGSERRALEAQARRLGVADAVRLPGFAANPFAVMARARLFALSSRYEGLPGALIQAVATGCPAVATDCPHGPREVLGGGRHGELVPVDDPAALAEAIVRGLETRPDTSAAQAHVRATYGVEAVAERYIEVLLPGRRRA